MMASHELPLPANSPSSSPTNSPNQAPVPSPPTAARPYVSRPSTVSAILRSLPTMPRFSTANFWSDSQSTACWASSYVR